MKSTTLGVAGLGNRRSGKVLVFVALLMTVLLGCAALAVDLGVIMLVRAQLSRASDAGSLAAATELKSGLGFGAYRTPEQVKTAGEAQAVAYVALHPAGEVASAHIEPARDVQFGRARLNTATGVWSFSWGATPYNAVSVRTLRSAEGTTDRDGPLPLMFARVLGHNTSNIAADSAAVIMPASSIRIPPGSGATSGLSPFAFSAETWRKYWRAAKYWKDNNMTATSLLESNGGHLILDPLDLDSNGDPLPLFYLKRLSGDSISYRPLFTDNYRVVNPAVEDPSAIALGSDGILELNIYPLDNTAGNFGTVNIGTSSNSTQVMKDQIENGITEEQLSAYPDGTLTASSENPLVLSGNTGISAGIQSSLETIVGQKRAIALYDTVANPGNNASYTIGDFAAIRIMDVKLSNNPKTLTVQPDTLSDPSFVPDYNEEIGDETTMFSPLILAR